VPRIWEKLKVGPEAMVAGLEDEQRRTATEWALEVGLRKVSRVQAGEEVPPELLEEWEKADERVLSKARSLLGLDEIKACNVGAAPTAPEVIEFFHALGIPLAELWGMSETTGAGNRQSPRADQDRHRGADRARRRGEARRRRRGARQGARS
jgi:long-chain acyl-CoA synthetase